MPVNASGQYSRLYSFQQDAVSADATIKAAKIDAEIDGIIGAFNSLTNGAVPFNGAKISAGTIDGRAFVTGSIDETRFTAAVQARLTPTGATDGQYLKWNGTRWVGAAISTHDDNLVTVFTDAPVLYAGATNGHISPLDVTITTTGGKVRVEFNMNYEVSPDVIFRIHRNGIVLPLPAPSGRITGHFAAGYDNELSSTPIFNSFVIYDDAPAGTHVYGLFYASTSAHGFAFNRTLHDAPLAAYERTVSSSAAWEIK